MRHEAAAEQLVFWLLPAGFAMVLGCCQLVLAGVHHGNDIFGCCQLVLDTLLSVSGQRIYLTYRIVGFAILRVSEIL